MRWQRGRNMLADRRMPRVAYRQRVSGGARLLQRSLCRYLRFELLRLRKEMRRGQADLRARPERLRVRRRVVRSPGLGVRRHHPRVSRAGIKARNNTFIANDSGVRFQASDQFLQEYASDFGTESDPGNNGFRCNSCPVVTEEGNSCPTIVSGDTIVDHEGIGASRASICWQLLGPPSSRRRRPSRSRRMLLMSRHAAMAVSSSTRPGPRQRPRRAQMLERREALAHGSPEQAMSATECPSATAHGCPPSWSRPWHGLGLLSRECYRTFLLLSYPSRDELLLRFRDFHARNAARR